MRPLPLLLCLAALTTAVPAGADNPRITLRLERATAQEIAGALSKAARVPVSLFGEDQDPREQPPPIEGLEQKTSIDWKNLPLADALRDLCKKYPLQPMRSQGGGYTLQPLFEAPPAPVARRVGLVEQQGLRLYALGANVNINRTLRFDGGPQEGVNILVLEVAGELPGGAAESIAGLANVSAQDDLGHVLLPVGEVVGRNVYVPAYPDEFRGHLAFNRPHPRAKKLAWVKGDVLVHRTFKPYAIEIPLPVPAAGNRKTAGPFTIEASGYEPNARLPTEQLPSPEFKPGPRVRLRISARPGTELPEAEEVWRSAPALVDRNGRLYPPVLLEPGAEGAEPGSMELNCVYQVPLAPVDHLLLRVVERSAPEKLFTFRMKDIPLPPEDLPTARPLEKLPTNDPQLAVAAPSEAILVQRIEIAGHPAHGGTLSLGLSRKGPRGWGAVRWQEVEVGEDGTARLAGVIPGAYRIERRYRAKDGAALPAAGAWNAATAELTLSRGKEVTAPPMRWQKKPLPSPARPTR